MHQSARSSLRQIGVEHDGLSRWYVVRALIVSGAILGLVAFVIAVKTQALDEDGIWRAIYWLHDTAYLWIKGQVWVRLFPYSNLWLFPTVFAVLLTAIEFLTTFGPVRGVHRQVILALAHRPWGMRFLGRRIASQHIDAAVWQAGLAAEAGPERRWFGFARRVVRRAQEDMWTRLATGLADGEGIGSKDATRLLRLSEMRLRLNVSDPVAHLRAVEIIAALPASPDRQALGGTLRKFYKGQASPELVGAIDGALATLLNLATADALTAREHVRNACLSLQLMQRALEPLGSQAAVQLVCDVLVTFAFAMSRMFQMPETLAFQRLWFKARIAKDRPELVDALLTVEGLIYFEMWSKLAEGAPKPLDPHGLAARAFISETTDVAALVQAVEHYAWKGSVS